MLYIDTKYANMLSPNLQLFKYKGNNLWNFRCPYCGDSQRSKFKSRGYIYRKNDALFYTCKNCDHGTTIGNLIKFLNGELYKQYYLEKFKERASPHITTVDKETSEPVELRDDVLSIPCILELADDHPAVKYVEKRLIPEDKWNLIYYAPKFKEWTNRVRQSYFPEIYQDHPRLILPYFTEHGKVFAFSARAFGDEEPKYYNMKLDPDREIVYGLERLDYSKRVYCFEGQIDSLFIDNGIAVSGASFNFRTLDYLKTNLTFVIDNEPRSKDITKILKKVIGLGFSVCMFPDTVVEKDINLMIEAGRSPAEIKKLIDDNTFSGLAAEMKFVEWRKIDASDGGKDRKNPS